MATSKLERTLNFVLVAIICQCLDYIIVFKDVCFWKMIFVMF